jgi:hypothetical protein
MTVKLFYVYFASGGGLSSGHHISGSTSLTLLGGLPGVIHTLWLVLCNKSLSN